jgi:hypothetical protein
VLVLSVGLNAGVCAVATDRASLPITDWPVGATPAVRLRPGVEGVCETGATTVLLFDGAGAATPTADELVTRECGGSAAAIPAPLGAAVTPAVDGCA